MTQGLQMNQTLTLRLAPLMTPVLRRSRDERPEHAARDDDEAPWREPAVRR